MLNKIWFNKQCVSNNDIPKYGRGNIKNSSNVAKEVKEQNEKLWVRLEIRSLFGLVNRCN